MEQYRSCRLGGLGSESRLVDLNVSGGRQRVNGMRIMGAEGSYKESPSRVAYGL